MGAHKISIRWPGCLLEGQSQSIKESWQQRKSISIRFLPVFTFRRPAALEQRRLRSGMPSRHKAFFTFIFP